MAWGTSRLLLPWASEGKQRAKGHLVCTTELAWVRQRGQWWAGSKPAWDPSWGLGNADQQVRAFRGEPPLRGSVGVGGGGQGSLL